MSMASSHSRLVDAAWLKARLDDPQIRVVDATVHLTFDQNGAHTESGGATYEQAHVPGATFVDQLTDLTVHDGEAPFEAAPSERVGLKAWQDAGLPVDSGGASYAPSTFTPARRPELVAATDDVVDATSDSSVLIVNALDRDSFAAGRIPGSVNVPFPELVDEHGRLRPLDDLRPLFESVGALDAGVTPVAYCGGGIAATVVAFALKGLGRDDVKVYDGSMNAWTSDPDRPVEQG